MESFNIEINGHLYGVTSTNTENVFNVSANYELHKLSRDENGNWIETTPQVTPAKLPVRELGREIENRLTA